MYSGTFSKVYRARDNVSGEIVAMKVIERSVRFEANAKARRGVEAEVEVRAETPPAPAQLTRPRFSRP